MNLFHRKFHKNNTCQFWLVKEIKKSLLSFLFSCRVKVLYAELLFPIEKYTKKTHEFWPIVWLNHEAPSSTQINFSKVLGLYRLRESPRIRVQSFWGAIVYSFDYTKLLVYELQANINLFHLGMMLPCTLALSLPWHTIIWLWWC
jgi:hypothetical protein